MMASYEYPDDREETVVITAKVRLPVAQRIERLQAAVADQLDGDDEEFIFLKSTDELPRQRIIESIIDAFLGTDMPHEDVVRKYLKVNQRQYDEQYGYQYNPSMSMKRFQADRHDYEYEEDGLDPEPRRD